MDYSTNAIYDKLIFSNRSSLDLGKKIFLSRSLLPIEKQRLVPDAKNKLEEIFKEYGFKVLNPETLDIYDQISIISKADFIAGPQGSSLHLTVFANPETVVIEIGDEFQTIHPNTQQKIICETRGQNFYFIPYEIDNPNFDYLKIPIQTLKVGSLGTHNLLGLAKAKKARMLIASTSEVYGDPTVHPQTEDYWGNVNPVGPRGVYDEAKRFQEAMTMAYHTYHGLETRIVRIFNTYGPRMRLNDGRVLPAFIGQALRGEDLTMFGDGSQTRSFCYVDDLVEGIYRLLLSDYAQPVNIGNPDEITIKEFGEEIIKLTGTSQKLISLPLPTDDPKQRKPDITKARSILGWEPKVSRAEGLKITYDYFKSLSKEDLFRMAHHKTF
jgi:dTDP-glucose 4,6-dehydratase